MRFLVEKGFEKYEAALERCGASFSTFTHGMFAQDLKKEILDVVGSSCAQDIAILCGVRAGQALSKNPMFSDILIKPGYIEPTELTDYENFLLNVPARLRLNEQAWVFSSDDAFRKSADVFRLIGPYFTRPTSAFKTFESTVVLSEEDALEWSIMAETAHNRPGSRIVVCPAKEISKEYRFYVMNDKLIGSASYSPEEGRCPPVEAYEFFERAWSEVRRKFVRASTCVMDVGLVGDRWGIVEFNSLCSSGVYRDDIHDAIVKVFQAWVQ